ncbi:restriction endonuclease type II-like protein [Bombardia bombarda]|uniref:Restriction endonuclease type II-like protein n=1 Tax=Bombardia bombarda TaxID=252184 RepID=A0AA39X7X2_9PEZI|nr:restriction endonuclease type II-like protein [Bombardia bombarda]
MLSTPAKSSAQPSEASSSSRVVPPPPPRIQQPAPQRLDRAPPPGPNSTTAGESSKIIQPAPQALPSRSSGSSILVSPRQKGNPVLANLRSTPWEYSDMPADYGLGLTTCALFLSLKYHRLHPEYIYTRIRNLQGKFKLRILLTMVDIPNHEDSLRELSKTSLVNNVTVVLCWSAAEAARYLELYKSYEHAAFGAIRGQQAMGYAEKLVEFVTVPRSVNKADAVALVSTFGSLRHAVNADKEQVGVVGGWGEKKVKAWCKAVEQPFRVKKAGRRRAGGGGGSGSGSAVALRDGATARGEGSQGKTQQRQRQPGRDEGDEDDTVALIAAAAAESGRQPENAAAAGTPVRDEHLSDGIAAALAKLREKG